MAVSKLSIEQLPRFNQALQLFYDGRRNESLEIFSELSTDPVSKMYCRRIVEESETLASPVWNLTSK